MNLRITNPEREELVKMVVRSLSNTRVELRRTRKPEWHDQLREEEARLNKLLRKLTNSGH